MQSSEMRPDRLATGTSRLFRVSRATHLLRCLEYLQLLRVPAIAENTFPSPETSVIILNHSVFSSQTGSFFCSGPISYEYSPQFKYMTMVFSKNINRTLIFSRELTPRRNGLRKIPFAVKLSHNHTSGYVNGFVWVSPQGDFGGIFVQVANIDYSAMDSCVTFVKPSTRCSHKTFFLHETASRFSVFGGITCLTVGARERTFSLAVQRNFLS